MGRGNSIPSPVRGGDLLPGFDLCVDATHPYAQLATAAIRAACESTGTPRLRLLRPASQIEGAVCVLGCKAAAEFLADRPGNILLATGSKETALAVCRANGIPAILAMGRKGGSTVAAAICNALLYQTVKIMEG